MASKLFIVLLINVGVVELVQQSGELMSFSLLLGALLARIHRWLGLLRQECVDIGVGLDFVFPLEGGTNIGDIV